MTKTMQTAGENLFTNVKKFMETYAKYTEANSNGAAIEADVDRMTDAVRELRRSVKQVTKQIKKQAKNAAKQQAETTDA